MNKSIFNFLPTHCHKFLRQKILILSGILLFSGCADELHKAEVKFSNRKLPRAVFETPESVRDLAISEKNSSARSLEMGFRSFEEVYLEGKMKLDSLKDERAFIDVLREYSDVILYTDSIVRPIISAIPYQRICNRDRIYQTGQNIQKVIDDNYIVSTNADNYSDLALINSIHGIDKKNSRLFNIPIKIP